MSIAVKQIADRQTDPAPEMMTEYGVWAFESHHAPTFVMPVTVQPFPKLLFIQEGRGGVEFWPEDRKKRTKADCTLGECVYVPPFCPHRIVDDPAAPLSLYGLGVDLSRLVAAAKLEQMGQAGKLSMERTMLLGMRHRMRRLLYLVTQSNASSMLLACAIAIDTFAQLALADEKDRSHAQQDRNAGQGSIDEFLGWLESNFYEPIGIDEAARACQMSRRTFTSRFRERTGQTWVEYLNELRIGYACKLLAGSEASVTSIAFQSGFDDLSTFYRAMKRVTGKRPLDFR